MYTAVVGDRYCSCPPRRRLSFCTTVGKYISDHSEYIYIYISSMPAVDKYLNGMDHFNNNKNTARSGTQ